MASQEPSTSAPTTLADNSGSARQSREATHPASIDGKATEKSESGRPSHEQTHTATIDEKNTHVAEANELHGHRDVDAYSGWRWVLVCAALYITAFLYGLDNTIVADVQGAIVQQYGEVEKLGWIGIGFPLGSVATIFSLSKAYTVFDVKWMYIINIIMFEAGSALCGGANSMNALIVGRVWAGVGGAGMYLGLLNIFSHTTSPKQHPLYLSGTGLVFGTGCVLGPVVGGAFADSKATWRWAFYINLVICGAFAPIYFFVLKPLTMQPNRSILNKVAKFDWAGVLLNAGAYSFFVMGVSFGGTKWAWNSGETIAFLVLSAVLTAVYGVQQWFCLFTTAESRIFPVDLLKSRTQWLLHIGTVCGATSFFIPLYYIPLYYQFVHAENGVESAVRLLPFILVGIFAMALNGGVMSATGIYWPWYTAAGVFQIIGGAIYYACVDVTTSNAAMYGFSVLITLGGCLAQQAGYSISAFKAGPAKASEATGFINVAQTGGAMFALTLSSTIFQNVGRSKLQDALADHEVASADIRALLAGQRNQIFASADPVIKTLAVEAIVKTMNVVYILVIAAGALALVSSFFFKREKLNLQPQDSEKSDLETAL